MFSKIWRNRHLTNLGEKLVTCHKLQHTSQLFKLEKISTKLGIDYYSRAKIQIFTTVGSNSGKGLDCSPDV